METKELEKDFLTMVEAQKRTIYKVCYIYASNQDDLNDLFQETVLNLWKGFPRYRGDSKLTTWVYRIAMNTCITSLRRSNALILLWLEERSYEEIADILGITKTNVAVKLNRTKEKLKKMSNR